MHLSLETWTLLPTRTRFFVIRGNNKSISAVADVASRPQIRAVVLTTSIWCRAGRATWFVCKKAQVLRFDHCQSDSMLKMSDAKMQWRVFGVFNSWSHPIYCWGNELWMSVTVLTTSVLVRVVSAIIYIITHAHSANAFLVCTFELIRKARFLQSRTWKQRRQVKKKNN